MTIEQIYAAIRGGRSPIDLPHWTELSEPMRKVIEGAYGMGIFVAANYIDGNWADAHTMANHLRDVGNGVKPMYADDQN